MDFLITGNFLNISVYAIVDAIQIWLQAQEPKREEQTTLFSLHGRSG